MVTVLILLAVALIICLAFMGITTWMYFNLERDFQKQKEALKGFSTQFKLYSAGMTKKHDKADELLEEVKAQTSRAETMMKSSDAACKEANKAAEFAMTTIQEVRKMLNLEKKTGQQVIFVHGRPAEIRSTIDKDNTSMKDFKFEEKEESEDEPRS